MEPLQNIVSALAGAFNSGELSAVAADDAAKRKARQHAPVFITVTNNTQQAETSDALIAEHKARSILEGIPVAVKDVIDTQDMITTMGSNLYAQHQPQRDATIVAQLRAAGANILGKTNTHEFSYGIRGDTSAFGAVPNPHDPTRIAGGSSSGSAAAVAHGIVPVAVGSDTAGSIRVPAALCGVVGFKPTFDVLSTNGVYPLAQSFDTVGLLSTCVEDQQLTLHALGLTDFDPQAEPKGERFTFRNLVGNPGLSPGTQLGSPEITLPLHLDFEPIEHPTFDGDYADFRKLFNTVRSREAYLVHEYNINQRPEQYQELTLTRIKNGANISDQDVADTTMQIARMAQRYLEVFDDDTVLLTPTVPVDAPLRNQPAGTGSEALVSLSVVWNLLGWPAISLPFWVDGDPLPKAVQAIAKPGHDAVLLRAARHLEHRLAQQGS